MKTHDLNLESYFSQIRYAAGVFDLERRLIHRSPSFEALFGVLGEDKRVHHLSDLLAANSFLIELMEKVFRFRSRFYLREIDVVGGLGHHLCNVEIFPLYDDAQELGGAVIALVDVKESSFFFEQKRRADSISHLSLIAGGLAHEIKNPLSGMKGAAQLLLNEPGITPRQGKYLGIVVNEVNRIDRLVGELLHLSKPKSLCFAAVNINRVLHQLRDMTLVAGGKMVEIVENFDPSLPDINADEDALRQIFLNLIRNAIDAIPARGTVRLTSQIVPELTLKTGQKKRQIMRVTVADNGCGIPEDKLEKIFTPFYSDKLRGTGLGLAIVNQLVELHSGSVSVKSKPGVGTTVSVFLPV